MAIHPGYMGTCTVVGINPFRFESATLTAKQTFEIPDMVMGHWDRGAYHPGKIDISGSLSGPATESFAAGGATSLFGWAVKRLDCGQLQSKDLDLIYYCDGGSGQGGGGGEQARSFTSVFANNVTFSCSAGDNAQFTIDLMSMEYPEWITQDPVQNLVTEKVITWDNTAVVITSGDVTVPTDALLSSFEFSINNNCAPYYSLTASRGYLPTAIVPGLRTITGSITAYDPQAFDGVFGFDTVAPPYPGAAWSADTGRSTIQFQLGSNTFEFRVMFHRVEPTLSVGPIMSTIAFTGTGIQTDLNAAY